jgi:thymidylate synthase
MERLEKITMDEVIDQLEQVIDMIKSNPNSRRIIVSAWNVGELDEMALMPCHAFFQFHVANGNSIVSYIKEVLMYFLGVPFQHRILCNC